MAVSPHDFATDIMQTFLKANTGKLDVGLAAAEIDKLQSKKVKCYHCKKDFTAKAGLTFTGRGAFTLSCPNCNEKLVTVSAQG